MPLISLPEILQWHQKPGMLWIRFFFGGGVETLEALASVDCAEVALMFSKYDNK